jgi:hypothetical protein
MNPKVTLKYLSDAIDLLELLRSISSKYKEQEITGDGAPWGGISLTIEQARKLVAKAYQQTLLEPALDSMIAPIETKDESRSVVEPVRKTLADRIRKIPRKEGSMREFDQSSGTYREMSSATE